MAELVVECQKNSRDLAEAMQTAEAKRGHNGIVEDTADLVEMEHTKFRSRDDRPGV